MDSNAATMFSSKEDGNSTLCFNILDAAYPPPMDIGIELAVQHTYNNGIQQQVSPNLQGALQSWVSNNECGPNPALLADVLRNKGYIHMASYIESLLEESTYECTIPFWWTWACGPWAALLIVGTMGCFADCNTKTPQSIKKKINRHGRRLHPWFSNVVRVLRAKLARNNVAVGDATTSSMDAAQGSASALSQGFNSSEKPKGATVNFTEAEVPLIVNVTLCDLLIERHRAETYNITTNPRGEALIINNIDFDDTRLSTRHGAQNDTAYLKSLFEQLGYNPVKVHENIADRVEFATAISQFKEEMEETGLPPASMVVAVMSHGRRDNVFLTDGSCVDVWDDLVYQFDGKRCSILKGVPKIFILQTCQGERTEIDSLASSPTARRDPQIADILVCFSTIPKYVSYRDVYLGSWYIYCLTKVFMENAHRMHLTEMLDEVQKQLIYAENEEGVTQVCSYTGFIFQKKFYFNPMKPVGLH